MIGETPPSSLVIGFVEQRRARALLSRRASSPVPQTIASWVTALPVMCTWRDVVVVREVAADVGAALHDAQQPGLDQRSERRLSRRRSMSRMIGLSLSSTARLCATSS